MTDYGWVDRASPTTSREYSDAWNGRPVTRRLQLVTGDGRASMSRPRSGQADCRRRATNPTTA